MIEIIKASLLSPEVAPKALHLLEQANVVGAGFLQLVNSLRGCRLETLLIALHPLGFVQVEVETHPSHVVVFPQTL